MELVWLIYQRCKLKVVTSTLVSVSATYFPPSECLAAADFLSTDQGANAQLDHEDPVAQVAPQSAKGRFRRETEVGQGGEKRLSRMKGDMW